MQRQHDPRSPTWQGIVTMMHRYPFLTMFGIFGAVVIIIIYALTIDTNPLWSKPRNSPVTYTSPQ